MAVKFGFNVYVAITEVEDPHNDSDDDDYHGGEGQKIHICLLLNETTEEVLRGRGEVLSSETTSNEGRFLIYGSQLRSSAVKRKVDDTLANMGMDRSRIREVHGDVSKAILKEINSFYRSHGLTLHTLYVNVHLDCKTTRRVERGSSSSSSSSSHRRNDSDESAGEQEICAICQYACLENQYNITTRCHHKFHEYCLMGWLEVGWSTCPVCRSDVSYIS